MEGGRGTVGVSFLLQYPFLSGRYYVGRGEGLTSFYQHPFLPGVLCGRGSEFPASSILFNL